jgi:hypothetical protein
MRRDEVLSLLGAPDDKPQADGQIFASARRDCSDDVREALYYERSDGMPRTIFIDSHAKVACISDNVIFKVWH